MTGIVFFGTPEEAVPALREIHQRFEVELVVTQPDRPKGRSGKPVPPPVKEFAGDHDIRVAQPSGAAELSATVAGGHALGVVVAYGRVLRPDVLEAFQHGILNIHFSLLPRWRGAAPVARALMSGDPMTGVTIIRIDEGLDTGPVLTAQAVDVHPADDAGRLTSRLSELGARLMVHTIPGYLSGEVTPIEQSDEGATYASKLEPADRLLDNDRLPEVFLGRVRGLSPAPGATLQIDGDPHKILAARRLESPPPHEQRWEGRDGWPVVNVGGATIALVQLQPPGKRPMSGDDWLRGRQSAAGEVGSHPPGVASPA